MSQQKPRVIAKIT